MLTMVALLAVPAAAIVPRRYRILGVSLILEGVALVALFSGSRSGWLALAIAATIAILVGMLTTRGRAALRELVAWVGRQRLQAAFLAASWLLIAVFTYTLLPPVSARAGAGGEDLRTTLWTVAARLFGQSPIVGIGPGMWVVDRVGATQSSEIDYYIPHAHDVPIQALSELGIVGGLVGLLVIAAVGWLLYSAWRHGTSERRWLAWLTFAALLYLGLHDILDFYPNMPAVMLAAALPVARLDAMMDAGELPTGLRELPARLVSLVGRQPAGVVAGVIVAVCCVGLVAQEVPAVANESAVDAANAGRWDDALGPAQAAAALDPDIHAYEMTLGLAAAHAGDISSAGANFRFVATSDDLPEAWLDLAAMESDSGQAQSALEALGRSMRVGHQHPAIAMAAGDLYLRLGSPDKAVSAFADALVEEPSLAADPWWHTDPQRDRVYPQVVGAALAQADSEGAWQIVLMTGALDRARTLASEATNPSDDVLLVNAWAGDENAIDGLLARCRRNPLDLFSLIWCSRIADRSGRPADAQAFRGLLEAQDGSAVDHTYELRVDATSGGSAVSGLAAAYWGTYTYRRSTPVGMIVPGLVHLTLE